MSADCSYSGWKNNMNMHHLKTAYYNLRSAGLRTILAMLGILVGTGAVVAMVSTGEMATEEALLQFKKLGTDLMSVSLSSPTDKAGVAKGEKKVDFVMAANVKKISSDILIAAPYIGGYVQVNYLGFSGTADMMGATEELAQVVNIRLRQGRFVSSLDRLERFCVIGNKLYEEIRKYNENPLNTRIKLNNQIYTIVGIAEPFPENTFLFQDINNSVIVPILTARFISSAEIDNIVMKLKPNADINQIEKNIKNYFDRQGIEKEFFFRTAQELIKNMTAQSKIFTWLLSLIGSISLLVGGIGVMNIMLVSVLERRREIGIRLALGARRKEIQTMFLTEAVLLAVFGGSLGVLIGMLFSFLVALFLHWKFMIFLLPPFVGFTVSVFIGIFFGYYPAYKAAKLDPIQTLRAE